MTISHRNRETQYNGALGEGISQNTRETQRRQASGEGARSHEETHAGSAPSPIKLLSQLIAVYYDVQDVRIRSFNRLRIVGVVEGVNPVGLKKYEEELAKTIEKTIRENMQNTPIFSWLMNIKGIGAVLAGGLVSEIDIKKAKTISSLWKYAGLHVENGKAVRRRSGKKLDFNPSLRALCWKIADSFLKHQTEPYVSIYYSAKARESDKLNHPEEEPENCPYYAECVERLREKAKRVGRMEKTPPCKEHIHLRATRKMIKRFLADFWSAWRTVEGLPVKEPYFLSKHDVKAGEGEEK